MFTETDERNAWMALKSTANRIIREIDALNSGKEVLQEQITTLEQIRTERGQMSLPDKLTRRGLYSDGPFVGADEVKYAGSTENGERYEVSEQG